MKPLEGIKVLDLTTVLSGPFSTMILADYGAEVIKIENPKGELGREMPPIDESSGESGFFANYNRNKKGVSLNLKNEKALALFYDLLKDADIVVENYKGGVTKSLKIDYETVKTIKPDIIYASISGFGQYGPYTHRPCFDIIAQAMSGLLDLTGYPDSAPVKVGPAIADHVSGMNVVIGILMALYFRKCTGIGQHIDVSMLDTTFSLLENAIPFYSMTGNNLTRRGNEDMTLQPFDVYEANDGYIAIGVGSDRMYANFCHVIGHDELISDPRYLTNDMRVKNYEPELKGLISSWANQKSKAEIEKMMYEAKIPCGPVLTVGEAMEHPHFVARDMIKKCNHPVLGEMQLQGCAIKMSETPGEIYRPAPLLGQDNAEVFGLSKEELKKLKTEGAI